MILYTFCCTLNSWIRELENSFFDVTNRLFDFLQSEFREIILVKLQRCDNSDFMVALAPLLQDFISFFSSFIHEKLLCCTVLVLYVIWKLLCHPHRKKAAVKNPKTLLSKWPVFHCWNNCFVHPIFSSFGFWYFGHFSCMIFFPVFFHLAHLALQQRLCNIFVFS